MSTTSGTTTEAGTPTPVPEPERTTTSAPVSTTTTTSASASASGKKNKYVVGLSTTDISIDKSKLPPQARVWVDPADKRYEGHIKFVDGTISGVGRFLLARLIEGFTDQPGVRHLICAEESTQYQHFINETDISIHGDCMYIYVGLVHLPLNQSIPEGTKFSLSIDNRDGRTAMTILSDKLIPESPLKVIPFNRRNFLLHIMPGELIDARYVVGTSTNFSVREMTHFYLTGPEGSPITEFVFGTQLGTRPSDLLLRIISNIRGRLAIRINNEFDSLARQSGWSDLENVRKEFDTFLSELELSAKKSP